jgi:hypothetical protein
MGADQITTWISEERFAPFLERAGGEEALATELYLWHAQVAGASLTTLHHFEVALRNAIDRQLGAGEPDAPVQETWLLDPATLSVQGIAKVRTVLGRLDREGYPRKRNAGDVRLRDWASVRGAVGRVERLFDSCLRD